MYIIGVTIFMYNALDDIGETTPQKRPRKKSPSVQGPPVETLKL